MTAFPHVRGTHDPRRYVRNYWRMATAHIMPPGVPHHPARVKRLPKSWRLRKSGARFRTLPPRAPAEDRPMKFLGVVLALFCVEAVVAGAQEKPPRRTEPAPPLRVILF